MFKDFKMFPVFWDTEALYTIRNKKTNREYSHMYPIKQIYNTGRGEIDLLFGDNHITLRITQDDYFNWEVKKTNEGVLGW